MQLIRPAPGQRRKGTAQYVIHAAVSAGLFDRQDVVRFFHHANCFSAARGANAIKARVRVRDVVAGRAFANFFLGVANGIGKPQGIFRRGPQKKKRQALRRFLADSRKMFQLIDESFYRSGKIWHEACVAQPQAQAQTAQSSRYMTYASTKPSFGWSKTLGRRPTISKPAFCHSCTARSLALTTKLNCMARKPRSRARSSECSHIARPTPWPAA